MKIRNLTIALVIAGLSAFGAIAVACDNDGDGALTLEEFFAAVEALDEDLDTKSAEVDAEGEALGDDATVDEVVASFRQQIALVDEFVEGLEALDAPAEAEDLLDEAVSAGGEVVEIFNEGLDEGEDAATLDEFFAAFDDVETDAAFERFDQVCLAAEALAADNDIALDLNCEEE